MEVGTICGQSCSGSGSGSGSSSSGGGSPPPPPPPAQDGCYGITYAGQCEPDGTVIWCENQSLQGIDCPSFGKVCGWNAAGYYDCL